MWLPRRSDAPRGGGEGGNYHFLVDGTTNVQDFFCPSLPQEFPRFVRPFLLELGDLGSKDL